MAFMKYQKRDFYSLKLVKLNFSFQNKNLTLKTINVDSIDPAKSLVSALCGFLPSRDKWDISSQRSQSLVRDTIM